MDREHDESLNTDDVVDFFQKTANVIADAKIYFDGVEYVNEVKFWDWLTTEVVKNPIVGNEKLKLDSAYNISNWLNVRDKEGKIMKMEELLRNRGAEFDFVRNKQDDIFDFFKGIKWRRATPLEDSVLGIDAIEKNMFSGEEITHQIKAGLSDIFKSVDLRKYTDNLSDENLEKLRLMGIKHKPIDVIDVNEKIYDWRISEKGLERIIKRGDTHPDVRKSFEDDKLMRNGEKRLMDGMKGNAEPQIVLEGVVKQVGKGAVIGVICSVSMSSLKNYKDMNNGMISTEEYYKNVALDGLYGGAKGTIVSAVNIPVQMLAHSLSVGAPVTIPVMICLTAGVDKVLQPMFGKGEYLETLNSLKYSTNISECLLDFSLVSFISYNMRREMYFTVIESDMNHRNRKANSLKIDEELRSALEDI